MPCRRRPPCRTVIVGWTRDPILWRRRCRTAGDDGRSPSFQRQSALFRVPFLGIPIPQPACRRAAPARRSGPVLGRRRVASASSLPGNWAAKAVKSLAGGPEGTMSAFQSAMPLHIGQECASSPSFASLAEPQHGQVDGAAMTTCSRGRCSGKACGRGACARTP